MTTVTYYGHVPLTYLHYIDLATGKVLVAQPGQTYNVQPIGGNVLAAGTTMPMDGRWVATSSLLLEKKEDPPAEDEKPKRGRVTTPIKE